MGRSGAKCLLFGAILLVAGCGDDAGGKNLKASGGSSDQATQAAIEAQAKPVDKSDANFQKTANGDKRNTARDPGVSSGGGTSSAVLD